MCRPTSPLRILPGLEYAADLAGVPAISGSPIGMRRTRPEWQPGRAGANPVGRWDYGPWFWPPALPSALKRPAAESDLPRAGILHGHPGGQRLRLPLPRRAAHGLPLSDPECLQRPQSQPVAVYRRLGRRLRRHGHRNLRNRCVARHGCVLHHDEPRQALAIPLLPGSYIWVAAAASAPLP